MSDYQNFDKNPDRIRQLWPTLTDMTPDELREHVRKIRADRRQKKVTPKAKKASISSSETKANKIRKLLADNPALVAKLLGAEDGNDNKEG